MSNQSNLQASVRAATSTAHPYNGDFLQEFADSGTGGTTYNEQLLAWINGELSASHTSLPAAMQAYADNAGVTNWNAVTSI